MRLLYSAWKELKILFLDWGQLLALFAVPMVFISVMSFAMSDALTVNAGRIAVTVIDLDRGAQSANFLEAMERLGSVKAEVVDEGLDTVNGRIKSRKLGFAVVIPEGFTRAIEDGRAAEIHLVADPAAPAQDVRPAQSAAEGALRELEIEAEVKRRVPDLVDRAVDRAVTRSSEEVTNRISNRLMTQLPAPYGPAIRTELDKITIDKEQIRREGDDLRNETVFSETTQGRVTIARPPGTPDVPPPDTYQSNVPGYTITFLFLIASSMGASILQEKEAGTFRRLLSTPVSRVTVLLSKIIPYYLVNLLQWVLMFTVARFAFGMSWGAYPGTLVLISLVLALVSCGMGLAISAFSKTSGQLNGLVPLVSLTMAAVGGCMVPLQVMPRIMQDLSKFTPHGWALRAYQDVLVRGYGFEQVAPILGILLAWGVISMAVGIVRFRFE